MWPFRWGRDSTAVKLADGSDHLVGRRTALGGGYGTMAAEIEGGVEMATLSSSAGAQVRVVGAMALACEPLPRRSATLCVTVCALAVRTGVCATLHRRRRQRAARATATGRTFDATRMRPLLCARTRRDRTRDTPSQGSAKLPAGNPLKRTLTTWDLTSLGVGGIVGAGIYVLTGQAAALYAGPAVVLSFVVSGASRRVGGASPRLL